MILNIKKRIKQIYSISKTKKVMVCVGLLLSVMVFNLLWEQFVYLENRTEISKDICDQDFRMALSVSPFSATAFAEGYTYEIGDMNIESLKELQEAYIDRGATEMYTRIATKRYPTNNDMVDGELDTNANVHTLEQGLALCKLAAELDIPINPEIMCAYTYMDMEKQQAPRFEEYPEIYALQHGKAWEELTLDEINTVLKAYGKFVATEILSTGCTVNCWNLGNEANFGFAGVSVGLETAVNSALQGVPDWMRYILPTFGTNWLKENVWKYNAMEMVAVQEGILEAYEDLGINSNRVQFSTHIATVVSNPDNAVAYFNTMKEYGYDIDVAGISYYPSAPSTYMDSTILFKKTVDAIVEKCNLPVFIAEFSYPSGEMTGPFSGWSKQVLDYEMNEEGQLAIYQDTLAWGREHGVIGMRYWAPDFEGWSSMAMFEFENKHGVAKNILMNCLQ